MNNYYVTLLFNDGSLPGKLWHPEKLGTLPIRAINRAQAEMLAQHKIETALRIEVARYGSEVAGAWPVQYQVKNCAIA